MRKHLGDPRVEEVFGDSILWNFHADTLFGKVTSLLEHEENEILLELRRQLIIESRLLILLHLN